MATTTVTLTLTFQQPILADLMTHYTDQHGPSIGGLQANIGATDTTITLAQSANVAGQSLLIEGEVIPVVSQSGNTLTVVRGALASLGIAAAAHTTSAPVYVLTYASPVDMLMKEALQPWALGISNGLATVNRSAVFIAPTGTVSAS